MAVVALNITMPARGDAQMALMRPHASSGRFRVPRHVPRGGGAVDGAVTAVAGLDTRVGVGSRIELAPVEAHA